MYVFRSSGTRRMHTNTGVESGTGATTFHRFLPTLEAVHVEGKTSQKNVLQKLLLWQMCCL